MAEPKRLQSSAESEVAEARPSSSARRRCGKCEKNRALKFYTGPKGRVCTTCQRTRTRTTSHASRIQATYNLTADEYKALLAAQGGVCAVCKQPRSYNLNVDHCHRTGHVRGLLCRLCNGRLLTAARDNPQTLRNAADYLESPPAYAVVGERVVNLEQQDGRATRRARGRRRGHTAAAPR